MKLNSIILCLATEKGLAVAKSLQRYRSDYTFTICTFREKKAECFQDRILTEARRYGIRHVTLPEWRDSGAKILCEVNADAIICVGWRYLVPDEVAKLVNGNVIVAHDSLLPKLRGFSPLPTALICGEKQTGVTFLRASATVDAGAIYWQKSISIDDDDTIRDLIQKTIPLYIEGVEAALNGAFSDPFPQNEANATYSVWRGQDDYALDWSLSADCICRTIRALGSPYLGARTHLGGREVIVAKATVFSDLPFAIRQPGKVWSLDEEGCPIVICGEGLLRIDNAIFADGQSLIPMNRLRVRFQ